MISRARHGIEYIKGYMDYINLDSTQEKINKIFDVNFDMKDILITSDIIKEWIEQFSDYYDEANDYIFENVANNDGKLFIDISKDGKIKYCFTDYNLKILTPTKYMNWDVPECKKNKCLTVDEIKTCEDNIKYINKNAILMTEEELQEFINFDYSKQINELANKLGIDIKKENSQSEQEKQEDLECEY